jgi:hypothetical protein
MAASPADTETNIGAVLASLRSRYPAFRFSREHVGRHGPCWVAERSDRRGHGLHTVITADLSELRTTLSSHADQEAPSHAG